MNGKDAGRIQGEALRALVPKEDWRIDVAVVGALGNDFRRTIETHPGEVNKDVLIWCYGSNTGKNPKESVAEIVCRVLQEQDHEQDHEKH